MTFLIAVAIFTLLGIFYPNLASYIFSIMISFGMVLIAWLAGPLVGLPKYAWPADNPTYFWTIFIVSFIFFLFGFKDLLNKR